METEIAAVGVAAAGAIDIPNGIVLTSPNLDLSAGGVTIQYDYFLRLTNEDGVDALVVEISGNAGLEELYGTEVPVLVLPGGETLRGRSAPGEIEGAPPRDGGGWGAVEVGSLHERQHVVRLDDRPQVHVA